MAVGGPPAVQKPRRHFLLVRRTATGRHPPSAAGGHPPYKKHLPELGQEDLETVEEFGLFVGVAQELGDVPASGLGSDRLRIVGDAVEFAQRFRDGDPAGPDLVVELQIRLLDASRALRDPCFGLWYPYLQEPLR